jgi:riboflavin biosynthesis pyrimidine reductase
MLEHGLLDELRLWIYPQIVGQGSPNDLLFGPSPGVAFNLVESTTLSNGIIILKYEFDKRLT